MIGLVARVLRYVWGWVVDLWLATVGVMGS